jgi:hypothetical protein
MIANGNVAIIVSNEVHYSSNPTKKVKGDTNELVVLSVDNVVIKMQGVCFKEKVMNRYGSWDISKSTYKCLQADLVDYDNFQTVI